MPYNSIDELPKHIKRLPEKKQRQFMKVFNSCYEEYKDEGKCMAMANGVVKETEEVIEKIKAFLAEAGRVFSAQNEAMLKQIIDELKSLLQQLGKEETEDAVNPDTINQAKELLARGKTLLEAEKSQARECAISESFTLKEAKDTGGWTWQAQIIEEGTSKNNFYYRDFVLTKALPLFEGAQSYDGHEARDSGAVKDLVGYFDNVKVVKEDAKTKVVATFHIVESADWLRRLFLSLKEASRLDLIGFSINGRGKSIPTSDGEKSYMLVEEIYFIESIDVVSRPAAGGRLRQLLESVGAKIFEADNGKNNTTEGSEVNMKDQELKELQERIKRAEEQVKLSECRSLLTEKLTLANIPQVMKDKIRARFEGKIFEAAELETAIKEYQDIFADFSKDIQPKDTRGPIKFVGEELDKKKKALDAMLEGTSVDGVAPYISIKQAYRDITGSRAEGAELTEAIMRAAHRFGTYMKEDGSVRTMLKESLDTSSFGEMLGDSITRKMIKEYNTPGLDDWKKIVSDISAIQDFRTNRRMRMGGYGVLPDISQGASYQPLTSPTDEEATFAISKKGGTEDLTMEMIANDDIGALKRIPQKLGRGAAMTLYKSIMDILVNNPNCTYDNTALFHSTHGNLGSAALSQAELGVIRRVFREKTAYNDTVVPLMLDLFQIFVPAELEGLAFDLTQSKVKVISTENSTQPNAYQGVQYTVVGYWTDANDWVATADPRLAPMIEVGFYQGRQEPELFVQDSPVVGSVFTADKITYKIRFIFGYAILDHRGMYKEVVA